jgi:indole-3-glycerol phosphate synthase
MASRFIDALVASPLPIVMEVKRRDANGVELMGERTIPELVSEYTAAGAPCISVVTGKWFGGDDQMLRDVAELTELPLLKKDFITRESQMIGAKEMGASAILLTARILPKSAFQSLIEKTLRNGLTPFVEVADHDELETVIHAEDCIVAINNKDIRNQERDRGDIDLSRSLLTATLETGTPCPVSASAITDPRVAAELIAAGFRGLLIGTGLLLSESIQGWVDEFERHRAELSESAPPTAPVTNGAAPTPKASG